MSLSSLSYSEKETVYEAIKEASKKNEYCIHCEQHNKRRNRELPEIKCTCIEDNLIEFIEEIVQERIEDIKKKIKNVQTVLEEIDCDSLSFERKYCRGY